MGGNAASFGDSLRRTARLIGLRRSLVTVALVILSVFAARFTWHAPLAVDAERALYGVRSWVFTPRVPHDPRIVLIVYNDATLAMTGKRSPLDRGLLAHALTNLDALKPRSIGIDILIDQPQPEDVVLLAALNGMRTPTYLGIARTSTNAESTEPWQEQYEREFLAQVHSPNVHPASVRLEADTDGVLRRWPHAQPGDPPSFASWMTNPGGAPVPNPDRSIAFKNKLLAPDIPPDQQRLFYEIPIDLFDTPLGANAVRDQIAGKNVLVGGDIKGEDAFDMPSTRLTGEQIHGIEVHGTMLVANLDGHFAKRATPSTLWFFAILIVLMAAGTGYRDFGTWGSVFLIGELLLIVALPFGLQRIGTDTQFLPAFGWIVGWTIAYGAASAAARGVGSDQRRFAQSTLGRYLPPEVAREILRDPERLKLSGERRAIYALFSDIEGFTTMTHAIPPETTAALLNRYLDRMSDIVLEHGGTIDKFVGDAVVAFWGAPIARPGDGENAIRAAIAIVEAGEAMRAEAASTGVTLGRTRVGVHHGEAIVGNFGGDGRIQYTALGDVMNTAARLEGANKALKTRALISDEATRGGTGIALRPMGRVLVRGRSTPVTVFEPVPEASAGGIAELSALIAAFDARAPNALESLDRYGADHRADPALTILIDRLKTAGPGGSYELG